MTSETYVIEVEYCDDCGQFKHGKIKSVGTHEEVVYFLKSFNIEVERYPVPEDIKFSILKMSLSGEYAGKVLMTKL